MLKITTRSFFSISPVERSDRNATKHAAPSGATKSPSLLFPHAMERPSGEKRHQPPVMESRQVPRTTVYEYFEIRKNTLIIRELPAWQQSTRRKPITLSKYYFFDVGVASKLQGRTIKAETPEFGAGFEAYVMHELTAYADYRSADDMQKRALNRIASQIATIAHTVTPISML